VTVVLNNATAMSYTYNFQVNQGSVGLLAQGGQANFTNVTLRGDDQAYAGGGAPQLAAALPPTPAATLPLRAGQLEPIIAAAIHYWTANPSFSQDAAALADVPFVIHNLPGLMLAQTIANTVVIDPSARGYGWFVDRTPYASEEFRHTHRGTWLATPSSPADGHMDLLTVVIHELGHVLGLRDVNLPANTNAVMNVKLAPGLRRLPYYPGSTALVSASTTKGPATHSQFVHGAKFSPMQFLVVPPGANFLVNAHATPTEKLSPPSSAHRGHGIEPPDKSKPLLSDAVLDELAARRGKAQNGARSRDELFKKWESLMM
jgi:hypothetical protein